MFLINFFGGHIATPASAEEQRRGTALIGGNTALGVAAHRSPEGHDGKTIASTAYGVQYFNCTALLVK